jgi:hypothetical protein
MIGACPSCGHKLKNKLNDGLSNCVNCNCVFSSTVFNELLAAAWQIRKNNLTIEQAQEQIKIDKDFIVLAYCFASLFEYSHDEFFSFLKKLGIKN